MPNMDDAEQVLREYLRPFGLESLAGLMYQNMNTGRITEDMTDDEKLNTLRDTPEYKERFKANELRRQKGLFELPPTQIVALERQYQATLNANQMPRSFYDSTDDYVNFLAADVSPLELQERIDQGYNAVAQANPEAIRQMKELYGVNESELAAYFLDPVRTKPIIERQARAARIGAEARLQAGMQLTQQQAEELSREGITAEQAQTGFSQIFRQQELFTPLAGEEQITAEEQVTGTFGTSAQAAQRIATRRRRRQAEFEGGGGFATAQRGVAGLGSAEQ